MSALGHVWMAPPWQELSELLQHWSGAVMCPACLCGGEAAGHVAKLLNWYVVRATQCRMRLFSVYLCCTTATPSGGDSWRSPHDCQRQSDSATASLLLGWIVRSCRGGTISTDQDGGSGELGAGNFVQV
jgi:hypothetical protein